MHRAMLKESAAELCSWVFLVLWIIPRLNVCYCIQRFPNQSGKNAHLRGIISILWVGLSLVTLVSLQSELNQHSGEPD